VNALVLKALARDPDDRFQSAGEMQREIDGILASLKPTPSRSDLGAYLQSLFASEARAGAAPVYPTAIPPPSSGPARSTLAVPSAAVPARQAAVAVVAPADVSRVIEELEAGRSRRTLWLAIGGVAAAGLVAYFLLGRGASTAPPAAPAPAGTETSGAPAADASRPAAEPPGATPSATAPAAEPNVNQLASAEVKRREDQLKKKYEDELAKRKAELDQLNTKPQGTPAVPVEPRSEPPAPAAPEPVEQNTQTQTEPPPITAPEAEAPPQPAVEPPIVAPQTPSVKEGDLVRSGAGVRPPVLVSLTKPEYPPMARRLKVEGTVLVSLLVDETGRVVETRLESGVSQNVGINEAAIKAVRSAVFSPATKDGVRVKMWHQLKIPFKL